MTHDINPTTWRASQSTNHNAPSNAAAPSRTAVTRPPTMSAAARMSMKLVPWRETTCGLGKPCGRMIWVIPAPRWGPAPRTRRRCALRSVRARVARAAARPGCRPSVAMPHACQACGPRRRLRRDPQLLTGGSSASGTTRDRSRDLLGLWFAAGLLEQNGGLVAPAAAFTRGDALDRFPDAARRVDEFAFELLVRGCLGHGNESAARQRPTKVWEWVQSWRYCRATVDAPKQDGKLPVL